MSWIAKPSIFVAGTLLRCLKICFAAACCSIWLRSSVIVVCLSSSVWAQGLLIEEDPDRRKILTILADLEDITSEKYSQLADAFDAGWGLAVRSEDPLLNLTTDREQSLEPGTSELDAGARYRLTQVFMNSPDAFKKIYQDQVKSAAQAAFDQAMKSADLSQLEAVVQRFQFTDVAKKGLQHLIQLRRSRGEFLQAALYHSRWMSLSADTDQRHRILQIQLWYQAGLAEDGLDDLSDLLAQSVGAEAEVLKKVAGVFEIEGKLPSSPITRDALSDWITNGIAAKAKTPQPEAAKQVVDTKVHSFQPLGNARRIQTNATFLAGQLESDWVQSTFSCLEAVELNAGLEELANRLKNNIPNALLMNEMIAPIASPIVIGDRLIVRCAMNLRALDLETGDPIWESFLLDRHLRSVLDKRTSGGLPLFSRSRFTQSPRKSSKLLFHWNQTNTGGQLTTDGRTVFAVEEVMSETLRGDAASQLETSRMPSNYLRAYDVQTGVLRGQAGGVVGINGEAGAVNPLAGMYFLGAPLVLGDRIYVIAEAEPGIYLLQLKATPLFGPADEFQLQPVRSQLLSVPRFPLRLHPVRNQAGIVPSYGRGLIICSTCDEHIIAISAEDHSVRWIYRYSTIVSPTEIGYAGGALAGASDPDTSSRFDRRSRWTDCLPRIINDRIIVTPRDSDELLCLDLQTGEQLWTMPRGEYRTVAAVDQDKVVVAGANVVSAFRLSDGGELWSTEIQDGLLCGSGCSDGEVLQLPTSRPGILAIRLSDGQQLLHQKTDRFPGNLFSTGKTLISQNATEVQKLVQPESTNQPLQAARQKLLEGDLTGAVVLLKQAIKQSSNAEQRRISQSQFVAATLNALRSENSAAVDLISDAEAMLVELRSRKDVVPLLFGQGIGIPPITPEFRRFQDLEQADRQWGELLELQTRGSLRDLSEPPKVVASQVFGLLKRAWGQRRNTISDTYRRVRSHRLVFQQVRTAIERRDPALQAELKQRLGQLLAEQLASEMSIVETRWWLNACMMIDVTGPAVDFINENPNRLTSIQGAFLDLVTRCHLDNAQSESAVNAVLNQLEDDSLVDVLLTTKQNRQWPDSAIDRDSESRFLATACLTTKQLSDTALDARLADLLRRQTPQHWPGVPQVIESDAHTVSGPAAMDRVGSVVEDLPVFDSNNQYRHWNFLVETTKERGPSVPVVNAYDAQGKWRWSHPLLAARPIRFSPSRNPTLNQYVVGLGQLVLIRRANDITMLDCSKASTRVNPRVLWQKKLSSLATRSIQNSRGVSSWERTTVYDRQPTGVAPAGPISALGLPIVLGSELFVFDPVSGIEQWHVTGVAEDATLTIRDDRLFLMSQSSSQIEVRNLVDGTVVGTRAIPDWWRDAEENSTTTPAYFELDANDSMPVRLQISDGHCILYRYGLQKVILESYDLETAEATWTREFPGESFVSNVSGAVVAVLSDGNQLQLIDTTSGAVTKAAQLPTSMSKIQYLYLRRSSDRWLVITDQFDQDHDEQNPVTQAVIINGAIYGLSPTNGNLIWDYPITHEFLRVRRPISRQPAIPPVAPILTLLKRPSPRANELGIRRGPTLYQAKILDVRTGQVLYSDTDVGYTLSHFHMKLQPEDHRVRLSFDKRTITFDYSEDSPAEDPPSPDSNTKP